jgi:transglutaminase-like putative cysteine protease
VASAARTEPGTWQAAPNPAAASLSTGQLLLLLATVAIALLPHGGNLPAGVLAGTAGAGFWRWGVIRGWWPMPGTLLRVTLTFAAVFAVTLRYRSISGLDAGSALLVTMMALKLLETRNLRDRSIVVLIAWFVLFAGFLRTQSLLSVPQLTAGLGIGLLALGQNIRPGRLLPARESLAVTGRLLAWAMPLAVVLFLLFPRLPGPFWATPVPDGGGRTGLADEMSPGDISNLAESDAVAFRVRFDGEPPAVSELYWRGPVLDQFDGRRWTAFPVNPRAAMPAPWPGPGTTLVDYEVILEPLGQPWLTPLDVPLDWDIATARLRPGATLATEQPVDRRMAYRARSGLAGAFRSPEPPESRTLTVPVNRNPRSVAFARELRSRSGSDREFVTALLRHFRTEPFYYTLRPPRLGSQPVDEFLFVTRSGFCEHYASAFALLARAGGIPARVVTGYQGGELNPIGDYWIVRQSDAHAWTELWLDGRWVRFDPTGAVAPERIEAGVDAALPATEGSGLTLLGETAWVERLVLSWDAVNATWDRWVLAFGPDRQAELLERLGLRAPTLGDIALVCAVTVSVLLLGYTVLATRRTGPRPDALEATWQRLLRTLARAARPRQPTEGPAEYARAVAAARPDLATEVLDLVGDYLRLRYEGTGSPEAVARFRTRVRHFRPAAAGTTGNGPAPR